MFAWMQVASALAGPPAFDQLATGEDFTCGRGTNDTVWCWGNNEDQQLGVARSKPRSVAPVDVGLAGVTTVSAAGVQGCATLTTGQVKCWGQARQPSWGTGVLPTVLGPPDAAAVTAGVARGCARRRGGGVLCWVPDGDTLPELGSLPIVEQLSLGGDHGCARVSGGGVWCWGDDKRGQLGGTRPGWPAGAGPVAGIDGAIDVSAGESNTCVVLATGKVWCWGPNADGLLGNGTTTQTWGPVEVQGLSGAVEVTVGRREACARTTDGKVWCWGADPCPRPDTPTRRLAPIDMGIRGATALSDGPTSDHRCAIAGGQPVCWGFNSHGQAGEGDRCVARP